MTRKTSKAMSTYENLVKNTFLSAYIRENISTEEKRNKIEAVLAQGADVNFKDANDNNNTALHVAVSAQEIDIVSFLLYRGAQVHHRNADGETPLDLATNINTEVGREIEAALKATLKFQEDLSKHTVNMENNDPNFINDNAENTTNQTSVNSKGKIPSYNKRAGTSGVTGQLYETKILSLVMLKASTDKDITEFYLGTNINGIGAFDDLCFRYKLNNYDKDILVTLQAKHRDDPETRKLTLNDIRNIGGDFGLPKYLDSYLKIKSKFHSKTEDPMFAGDFNNIECNFILYTPSKDMLEESLKTVRKQSPKVKELLNTCVHNQLTSVNEDLHIFQLNYTDTDVEFLTKFIAEEQIRNLGVTLMDFVINNGKFNNMLTDELIRTYHVVLAQQVIDVSCKAPSGLFRNGRFRPDFFYTNEQYVIILRESCYRELVTTHAKTLKLRKKETKKALQEMLLSPSGRTLSKILGTVLTHNEKLNKLELIEENMKAFKLDDVKQFKEYLKDIQFNESILNEAVETLCKEELVKKEFKLPNSFGNLDMTIRSSGSKDNRTDEKPGKKVKKTNKIHESNDNKQLIQNSDSKLETKIEQIKIDDKDSNTKEQKDKFSQRLDHLASKFVLLFEKFKETKVIEIDDNIVGPKKLLEEGFLDINGGIGGAVGNLLIFNNQSGFLQFDTDCTTDVASKFLSKLETVLSEKVQNKEKIKYAKEEIKSYMLNIKIAGFPRPSFHTNDYDKSTTRNFLDSLWFYTNQGKEDKVESILKSEIDYRYNAGRGNNIFRIHSDAIFLRFHDEIQKWWMLPGQVPYLTNERKIFEEINKFVVENPLLTVLNAMYINKVKKVGVEYNDDCLEHLKLDLYNEKIINVITEINILSGIKIVQHFKYRDITIIDFDYILSLPETDFTKMLSELKLLKIKTLLIIYDTPGKQYGIDQKLVQIINSFKILHGSKIIIITNHVFAKKIETLYSKEYAAVPDEHINLCNLTLNSQQKILEGAKIVFQDEEVDLLSVIDLENKHIIKANILWKLIHNEKIEIGRKLDVPICNNQQIDYCKRTLKLYDTFEVDSLNDLEENVVAITANPAMGKTVLLKHLALQTKKETPEMWIAFINFFYCSEDFCTWQDKKSPITLEDEFKLLCKVVLRNCVISSKFDVERVEDKIVLVNCVSLDPAVLFELELFVDFYNKRKMIFLFDDFDDVCPPYEREALALLHRVERDNNKLWITSRSYPAPKSVLHREFGCTYTLTPIDVAEQRGFLSRFFKTNINLEKLNNEQASNVSALLKYISGKKELDHDDRPLVPLISIPLHIIYIIAVEFFKSEINNITSSTIRDTLKERWNFDVDSWGTLSSFSNECSEEMQEAMELAGTPLHMYIAANYFQLQLNESVKMTVNKDEMLKKWDICTNAAILYKKFLESTLKGVCFQRNGSYEDIDEDRQLQLRRDFLERHKKLALLAICKEDDLNKLLRKEEINELKDTITRIQKGEERSAVIDCVLNDVPRFFHLIFAEYFIVEVLVDMLKSLSQGDLIDLRKHKAVWDFLINILLFNCPVSIRRVFNYKLVHDPELQAITNKDYCRELVFELLLKQNDANQASTSGDARPYTLKMAVTDGLNNLLEFFINCIKDNLSRRNINRFIDMLKSGDFVSLPLGNQNKMFIDTIAEVVRRVDHDKLVDLVTSEAFVEVPARLALLAGGERQAEDVRRHMTVARHQLMADSGELFGISRDTSNLLRGVFAVFMEEMRK